MKACGDVFVHERVVDSHVQRWRIELKNSHVETVDVVLIGGGIMSATLASVLQKLRPDWSFAMYEREDEVATESSGDWNNSGTGHGGLCELNYTPQNPDGSIQTTKALTVNGQFYESLLYWAHLTETGAMSDPGSFVRTIPHVSFVTGEEDVNYLRDRFEALKPSPAFHTMEFSDSRDVLEEWAPLMFEGRDSTGPVAMTRSVAGTDVNFGEVTRQLVRGAMAAGMTLRTGHEVTNLERQPTGWRVSVKNRKSGAKSQVDARFVFIGAGGAAIHLLQKSGIPEAKGYGGFPVSGQFLRCTNPELIARHSAKVYGKPQLNAPPMSMPHLDSRSVDGEPVLLFGPFAGFEPRFLKNGSLLDLFKSIKPDNLMTYLNVAKDEMGLTMYLIRQLLLRSSQRIDVLRDFMPLAKEGDWELHNAGMRVQTLKPGPNGRGKLEFGTEVVAAGDGTIAGLLGASPGASASVSIVLNILERCFPDEMARGMKAELGEIFRMRSVDPAATSDYDLEDSEAIIYDQLGLEGFRPAVPA